MDFGLATFPTDYSAPPAELARAAEERGFESRFFAEHTHIPASRETPYPAGGDLPPEYWHTHDPFVALATAAAVTESLRVATGICLVIERDPITTAKEVATLDFLSRGRFLFGVGAGWNVEEMRNHGTNATRRFGLLKERVEAMKAIWAEEEASYTGRYVDFEPIWSWPKPVQQPHPPILVGGNGEGVIDRVLAYGDEWLPNRVGEPERLLARVEELRRRGHEEQGREIGVTLYGAPTDRAQLEANDRAGLNRAVFWLRSQPLAELEGRLDKCAELAAAYRSG